MQSQEQVASCGGPEPPDPDDDDSSSAAVENISQHTKEHILQDHHRWKTIFKNPVESWDKIKLMIKETLKRGNEVVHAAHPEQIVYAKSFTIDSIKIIVRYVKNDGIIKISNAMLAR